MTGKEMQAALEVLHRYGEVEITAEQDEVWAHVKPWLHIIAEYNEKTMEVEIVKNGRMSKEDIEVMHSAGWDWDLEEEAWHSLLGREVP